MSKLVPAYSLSYTLINFFVAGLFFILGLIVLRRKPNDKAAVLFHWTSMAIVAMISQMWGGYAFGIDVLDIILPSTYFVALAFMPALFIHFTLTFPHPKTHRRKLLIPVYVLSAGYSLWMSILFFRLPFPPTIEEFQVFLQVFHSGSWVYCHQHRCRNR